MAEFYPEIRLVHITAVIVSGGLFLLRGLAVRAGAGWAMAAPLRRLTYAVDTVLLAAALTLTVIVGQYPFLDAWLPVKVLLLVVYILLGTFALRRGSTRTGRPLCFVAALLAHPWYSGVASAHHPLEIGRTP